VAAAEAGDRNGRARGGGCFQPALAQGGDARRRQVKGRGLDKLRAAFVFAMAAYNIVRLPKLMAARGELRPAP
jgi:hypothetical protein